MQIGQILNFMIYKLPASALEMFTWHNGTRRALGMDFFPGFAFDSLALEIEAYKSVITEPNLLQLGYWSDKFFPIFASGAGDYYGINCNQGSSQDGEVVCYTFAIGTQVEFASLEAMLLTLLKSYESGVYFVNAQNQLDVNEKKFRKIAKKINPNLDRWKIDL